MARKYSRDNRGRFASGGGGATARGGRLRTAAGNKRATQTMKAAGGGGDGVIRGRAARTVAGESVMRKLPKAAPKAVATAKGARVGGKMAKTSLPKPGTVAPMKGQDKAFQSLANLKKAEAFSSPKAPIKSVFLPREQMTRSRAEKVGLIDRNGLRRSSAESPRMRVTEMASGSRQGYVISPRSGVKANQARQRMAGTIAKPAGLKPRPAKPAAPAKAKAAPKRVTAARPAETIRKPAGLQPGAVEKSIANKARGEIKANQTRMDRTDARYRQLTRAQRDIDYKRENPIGGRAFRAQATKKLNKAEKKLRKSRDIVYGAKALNYQPRIDKALDKLAAVTSARNRANQLPKVSRRGAQYQRSIFGGATVKYS